MHMRYPLDSTARSTLKEARTRAVAPAIVPPLTIQVAWIALLLGLACCTGLTLANQRYAARDADLAQRAKRQALAELDAAQKSRERADALLARAWQLLGQAEAEHRTHDRSRRGRTEGLLDVAEMPLL